MLFAPTFGEGTYNPGRVRIETDVNVVLELAD
jgi:hypothetical protein